MTATASTAATAATFSDYVVDRLRADIVHGAIPPQARLALKALTERYAVGLSPVREALQRLAGEGFVQFVGQRGFTVPGLGLADLEDLTALRTLVETEALRQAVAGGDDVWEAGIVAAFHRLERQLARSAGADDEAARRSYEDLHRSFHLALCQSTAVSPRLRTLQAQLYDQALRYRQVLHRVPLSARRVLTEHRTLMTLALARDAQGLVQAATAHLQLTLSAGRKHLPAGEAA